MFLITRIWDSVFDPIVGVAADRTQTRWGKFRPYLLWLAIPFAAIGVLTFMTPSFGQTGNLIYAYITYSFDDDGVLRYKTCLMLPCLE